MRLAAAVALKYSREAAATTGEEFARQPSLHVISMY
jgi:hypothetical protein